MAHTSADDMSDVVIALLKKLIAIPSFSREEDATASLIQIFLQDRDITVFREANNVWAVNHHFSTSKPTILLNSHHDTVKPNKGYTLDPFEPIVEDGKLYGLGSNDAGGPLVTLLGVFLYFYDKDDLPFNVIYAATAEEEISGADGIESIISELGDIHLAIVGEPTFMEMAVAERGLLVIDCVAEGKAGHAARNEGINAIYAAMVDIEWFRTFRFPKESQWLGAVSMNATMINAGTAHNQVPSECSFTVDIRLNDCYTHEEILSTIRENVKCTVKERSTRIKPSFIPADHPMLAVAKQQSIVQYGSPTTSDMALMPWYSVKMGPGDSARSHSADEYIHLHEIEDGLGIYIKLLEAYALTF